MQPTTPSPLANLKSPQGTPVQQNPQGAIPAQVLSQILNNPSLIQGNSQQSVAMGSYLKQSTMGATTAGATSTGFPNFTRFGMPATPTASVFQPQAEAQAYHPDPSNVFPSTPYSPVSELFMAQQLRSKFQQAPASTSRNTTVASSKFSHYTAIVNVDLKANESQLHRGLVTQVYRTTNRFNGKHVILRRLVNATASPQECLAVYERLRHFRHPNLSPLHSITPTSEFVLGSDDIIVESRMVKRAKSMQEAFFAPRSQLQTDNAAAAAGPTTAGTVAQLLNGNSVGTQAEISEGLLWSIASQLVGLIRTFHDVHVAVRGLHLSKLMWVDIVGRIYFTGLGLMDLAEPSANVALEMKRDIQQLGLVLLQLASHNPSIQTSEAKAALQRTHRFSQSFVNLVTVCLDANVEINALCRGLGERLSMEVGHQSGNVDFLLSECSKEVHNGRLMRLMIKLSFTLENQEISDYGDGAEKYVLKLFCQYVFNQVDEQNRPRLDWGHVYHSLNKLDCSSEDLIQLISQDNSTVLVISYRDIRLLLDRSFEQLQQPGHDLSYAGLAMLQQQQQPTSTPPTIPPPQ